MTPEQTNQPVTDRPDDRWLEWSGGQYPDTSPGDVIAAEADGTIVLDDGITTWNPLRAAAFLADALEAAQKERTDQAWGALYEAVGRANRAEDRVRQLEEALEAADALRERVRREDDRGRDLGRWREAAAYDDAREVLAAKENTTP